jgi:hypothetical protein
MPRQQASNTKHHHATNSVRPSFVLKKPTNTIEPVLKQSSFGQTMKEGFAFGIGSAIAQKAIGTIFGSHSSPSSLESFSSTVEQDTKILDSMNTVTSQDRIDQVEYIQCIKEGGTHDSCKQFMS